MLSATPHNRKQALVWKKVDNAVADLATKKLSETPSAERNTSTASTVTSAETSTTTSTVSSVANAEPKRPHATPSSARSISAHTATTARNTTNANPNTSAQSSGDSSIWAQKAASRAALASKGKSKADGVGESQGSNRFTPGSSKAASSARNYTQNDGLNPQGRKRFHQYPQHRHHHHQHHYNHHHDDEIKENHKGSDALDGHPDSARRKANRNYVNTTHPSGPDVDNDRDHQPNTNTNTNTSVNLNLQTKYRQRPNGKQKYQPNTRNRQQRQAFHHHHHHHHHHHYHSRRPFPPARGSGTRDMLRQPGKYNTLTQPRADLVPERIISAEYYRDDQLVSDEYGFDDAEYDDDELYEDEYYFDDDEGLELVDHDSEYLEDVGYDDHPYEESPYVEDEAYPDQEYDEPLYEGAPIQESYPHTNGFLEQPYAEQIYPDPTYAETMYPDGHYQEVGYQEAVYPDLIYPAQGYEHGTYQDGQYTEVIYQEPIYQETNYQEPIYQEPIYQEPIYQEPIYQDPIYQDPIYQEPAYPEQTYEGPLYHQQMYHDPLYQDPNYQQVPYSEPVYVGNAYPEDHVNTDMYLSEEHRMTHTHHHPHHKMYHSGGVDVYANSDAIIHPEFLHPEILPFPDMYPIPEEPVDPDTQFSYPMRKARSFNAKPKQSGRRLRRARSRDASVQHRSSSTSTTSLTASSPSPVPSPPLRVGISVEEDDLHPFCLVCLEQVGVADPMWSCDQCYEIFHLSCIQPWSINRSSQNPPSNRQRSSHPHSSWECPKCRKPHPLEAGSLKYTCFCKKVEKPTPDPWLAPHSCGRVCDKKHSPDCNHRCEQLCHRGACPPCPQSVMKNCFCGREFKTLQCASPPFSCGQTCDRVLSCGVHKCSLACHEGPCPPCGHKMMRVCLCGKVEAIAACSKEVMRCDKKCGRRLPCGNHVCQEVCHKGQCSPCPLTGPRICPCGKKSGLRLPCKLETPSCGDVCGKVLTCTKHRCQEKCHKGNCSPCPRLTIKSCACRSTRAEVQCGETLKCEVKCNRMRSCQRHVCRQNCCDGKCAPCPETCNRKLGCGLHTCTLPCHSGPCFPCTSTFQLSCQCGETVRVFPCGKQEKAQAPHCSRSCQKATQCHHTDKETHRCHFGDCPPCKFTCEKKLENCDHLCTFPCHFAVDSSSTAQDNVESADKKSAKIPLPPPMPCPLCPIKVTRSCLGEHKSLEVTCSTPAFSCQLSCGRKLSCGNHTCQKPCHALPPPPSAEQLASGYNLPFDVINRTTNCGDCPLPCKLKRKCNHPCPKTCHTGACPPCSEMRRRKCHCGNRNIQLKCEEYTDAVNAPGVEMTDPKFNPTLAKLLSCNHVCNKKLPNCQHMCTDLCHPGACFEGKKCMKKVLVKCPCRRLKAEFMCFALQDAKERGELVLSCNEVCLQPRSASQRPSLPSAGDVSTTEDDVAQEKSSAPTISEEPSGSVPPKDRKLKKLKLATPKSSQDLKNRSASVLQQRLLMIACLVAALLIPILVLHVGL
eukprot:TRINITY_DN1720_c0_g1_i1.p1 TRINITY_DN1720_c0_g1~~TRINITY_DN1720_c0_g1_i1.p1  ORF type:complete len:1501 (+),score=227.76 TRINITY_DN1720_c0_g1_i1:207-4709(+)